MPNSNPKTYHLHVKLNLDDPRHRQIFVSLSRLGNRKKAGVVRDALEAYFLQQNESQVISLLHTILAKLDNLRPASSPGKETDDELKSNLIGALDEWA